MSALHEGLGHLILGFLSPGLVAFTTAQRVQSTLGFISVCPSPCLWVFKSLHCKTAMTGFGPLRVFDFPFHIWRAFPYPPPGGRPMRDQELHTDV